MNGGGFRSLGANLCRAYTIGQASNEMALTMMVRPVQRMFASGGCLLFQSPARSLFCSIAAQTVGGDPAKAQMQEMNRRELQLNDLGDKGRPNDPKRSQAMMDQVSGDFSESSPSQRNSARHYREAPAQLSIHLRCNGEIQKRSTRLQSSLKLPKPEIPIDTQEMALDLKVTQTNDKLLLLCRQIESFVRNPIIEKPGR